MHNFSYVLTAWSRQRSFKWKDRGGVSEERKNNSAGASKKPGQVVVGVRLHLSEWLVIDVLQTDSIDSGMESKERQRGRADSQESMCDRRGRLRDSTSTRNPVRIGNSRQLAWRSQAGLDCRSGRSTSRQLGMPTLRRRVTHGR